MSASVSGPVSQVTVALPARLAGIARTCAISWACWGACSAAWRKNERIAASLALRVGMLLPRSFSRWVRNAPIVSASRSVTCSWCGWRPARAAAKASSRVKVSR